MTQALKKMMLLAFVFAIASAAPKVTFKQAVSSLDATLRPHFTIRTDKGLKGGLSGVKGLVAMLIANRMVANESTGLTATSGYFSGIWNAENICDPKNFGFKVGAKIKALHIPFAGMRNFAKGFATDMNPFGSMTVVTNQAEIDAVVAANAAKDAIPLLDATVPLTLVQAQQAAEDAVPALADMSTFTNDEAPGGQTGLEKYQAALDARVLAVAAARASAVEVLTNEAAVAANFLEKTQGVLPARAESTKTMWAHKQVAGQKAYDAGQAPANFSWAGAKDGGRSLMAWFTIASVAYTALNTYRDYNDARFPKAAALKFAKEIAEDAAKALVVKEIVNIVAPVIGIV